MLKDARLYYEYKRAVMCMQHGITLRHALFNCVFTAATRCTLLPVGCVFLLLEVSAVFTPACCSVPIIRESY
jgi:hypothetical protein